MKYKKYRQQCAKIEKKHGQRRRDSAVCRTELLASNFFWGQKEKRHGAPQPPGGKKKKNPAEPRFFFEKVTHMGPQGRVVSAPLRARGQKHNKTI